MFIIPRISDVEESDEQAIVTLGKIGASDIPVVVNVVVLESPSGARGECVCMGGGVSWER